MMPQTNPQFPAMDQSDHDSPLGLCQVDCSTEVVAGGRKRAEPGQRNGGMASCSSPDSGSLNGDGKRGGKGRRRRKRAPPSERKQEGERPDQERSSDPRAALLGLQAECSSVWLQRSVFERAESLYQCWLACSSNAPTRPGRSPPPPSENHAAPQPPASPSPPPTACCHVVQAVQVNEQPSVPAERRVAEASMPPSVPNSLDLASNRPAAAASAPAATPTAPAPTPDEGYVSLAPTPATPTQQAAATPTVCQSVNGLPRIPVELLRDVWLEKPLYDRAEAAFYQNLYGNNSKPRANNCSSTSRSTEHPQSLVEEEEGEEEQEEENAAAAEERPAVPQGKAEVFHALHPIQEEEEPADIAEEEAEASGGGVCHFLHPDSEKVWLDRWHYEAAESRFHGDRARGEAEGPRGPDTGASTVGSAGPLRDKTMSALDFLAQENIWFDKTRYDAAERRYYECVNGPSQPTQDVGANSILQDIARARENIQKSLAGRRRTNLIIQETMSTGNAAGDQGELVSRIKSLELENQNLHKVWLVVEDLRSALSKLESRVAILEKSPGTPSPAPSPAPAPAPTAPCTNGKPAQEPQHQTSAPDEDEDDFDLFGSGDEDDTEAERLKEQRVKEYTERKAKKPALIAKSSILLDVKPWDDETDMVQLEASVRSIEADGLLWGTSKLVPVGYGINKLQIACVVEDDKVGTDLLEEEITKFEDYVQSVDVAAFNKI